MPSSCWAFIVPWNFEFLKAPSWVIHVPEEAPGITREPWTFGACPNVIGSTDIGGFSSKEALPSGAFANSILGNNQDFQRITSTTFNIETGNINAARCSSIYGSSTKVQPKSYQVLMIIKVW